MLSLSQMALLQLVRISIGKDDRKFDFSKLSVDDWDEVKKECKSQTVAILCFEAVAKYKELISEDMYNSWLKIAAYCVSKNLTVIKAQNELVEILNEHGFPYVILKGEAAAAYYPAPEKRMLGDIDFLVSERDKESVQNVLVNAGYRMKMEGHGCHLVFKKTHPDLEMHFEIAGIPTGRAGELFSDYLKGVTQKTITNQNPSFNSPVPQMHGVIILLHLLHHLVGEGVGLRHLCDWACFVDKTHNDSFWNDEIIPLLKKTGTLKFASVLTKMASTYLGTQCPEWAKDADEKLCEDVMLDILTSGNFGLKDKNRAGSVRIISPSAKSRGHGKISNMIVTLKETMYTAYPFLMKCKILYPFVFAWRIIKYLLLMIKGERPSLSVINQYADERMQIYNQFELYKDTEE